MKKVSIWLTRGEILYVKAFMDTFKTNWISKQFPPPKPSPLVLELSTIAAAAEPLETLEPENPSPEIKVTISSITAAEPAEPLEALEPENPSPEIKVTISTITAAEPLEALEPENPSPEIKVTTSSITAAEPLEALEPKNSSQFGSTYNEQHIQQHLCYCMKSGNCNSLLICASAIHKTIIW